EQIGSVYETMMGFRLETATGRSAAIRAAKRHGAPTTIDLDALLGAAPAKRRKWIQDCADRKLTDRVYKFVMEASTIEDLHAALEPVLEKNATPDLVPRGAMILQPSEERRRSGSHYTPRSLTEPIVRTTLEPILSRLRGSDGRPPPPEQILDLKVCDPAMGSGAFLVEACRQLGDTLVEAWHAHGELPEIPADEDEVILARRLVAQRCLYGIDRNPVAVDLAKVSLWLVTLAKDHPFTFLNHALRHGDSLVGLSRRQIEAFHWDPGAARFQAGFEVMRVGTHMKKVAELRAQIREADEGVSDLELRDLWDRARTELDRVRFYGDLVLAAFFEGKKTKERETKRGEFASAVATAEAEHYREWLRALRQADPPLAPLHWDIEFPEVFDGVHSGFDALVGNPPFLGGKNISGTLGLSYLAWIKETFPDAGGQADLVAYFFQRSYRLLCTSGHLGLLATNTIAQGDTRRASLRHLLSRGGHIYSAYRRRKWPGRAAVIVSIVHISKDIAPDLCTLDGKPVERISAFLFHFGPDDDPRRLAENRDISFAGPKVDGPGFTFDDLNSEATPVDVARELIERSPRDSQVIRPMIGGQEMLTHPRQHHRRYVIDFSDMSEAEARRWPHLISILEEKVKSRRLAGRLSRHPWWQFERTRPQMRAATAGLRRVLMHPFTSTNLAFAFVPSTTVVVTPHIVFANESDTLFCALQSRPHEIWARFFGSSMKDDLRYTPSDCFETFPFPENWEIHPALEAAGKECYEFRADLMVRNDEGLTKTYNRFHDPDERDPEILELRGLHAAMDRAVLDAYGWSDILTECQFLLDYEIDEEDWGRRRKPWRYRWPDEVRDEVLARLLELNAARAREEARAGLSKARKAGRKGARKPRRKTSSDGELFS
ncbi:MAG: N-6 DNA methylase, partial [Candidatus Eisenbacteria sp.]|nr:N-6 DNA methylase [Candidatus Eisenbacteria bacterium]